MSALAFVTPGLYPRVVRIANPGAGSEWSQAIPGDREWQVLTVRGTYTASAAVATRQVRLKFNDGTRDYWIVPTVLGENAGEQVIYGWATELGDVMLPTAGDNTVGIPLPRIVMLPGHRLLSDVRNRQSGDAWTDVSLYVLERVPGPLDEPAGTTLVDPLVAELALAG